MQKHSSTLAQGGDLVVYADHACFAILRPDEGEIRRVLVRSPEGIPVRDLIDRLDDAVTVFRPGRIWFSLGSGHRAPDDALVTGLRNALSGIEDRQRNWLQEIPDLKCLVACLRPRTPPRLPDVPAKPPDPPHPVSATPEIAPNFLAPRYGALGSC